MQSKPLTPNISLATKALEDHLEAINSAELKLYVLADLVALEIAAAEFCKNTAPEHYREVYGIHAAPWEEAYQVKNIDALPPLDGEEVSELIQSMGLEVLGSIESGSIAFCNAWSRRNSIGAVDWTTYQYTNLSGRMETAYWRKKAYQRDDSAVVAAVERAIELWVEECLDDAQEREERQPRPAAPVKFRDPATGSSWTGRGLKPRWLAAHLEAGRSLQEFAV